MAVTKILARKGRLDIGIDYILNGDKTEQKILTAHQGCEPGRECRQMLETKRDTENMGGVQYYHTAGSVPTRRTSSTPMPLRSGPIPRRSTPTMAGIWWTSTRTRA